MSEIAVTGTAAEVTATATTAKSEITHNNMKRKKRLGKCARRRAQKARAISNASSSFASGCGGDDVDKEREWTMTTTSMTTSSASSVQVPSDRGYTLEGVKVRRREWWARFEHDGRCHNHNRCGQENATSVSTTSTAAIDAFDEDNDVPLHPDDERALLSQLGYIPGNAICVAARLSSKEDALSSSHSSNTETSVQTAPQALPQPSVVKLYPMAARQKYGGGKSDGRAYKGRRRGAMRLESEESVHEDKETESEKDSTERPSQQHHHQQPPTVECKRRNEIQNNIIIEPFPTLYWLTHPQLHNQISKLELSTEYNVSKMEERLRSDPLYLQQMERAHLSYGRKRWEILTLKDRDYVLQCGWKSALDDSRGVAGIRLYKDDDGNFNDKCEDENGKPEKKEKNDGHRRSKGYDFVKCLHAHVAHYLAQISEWEEGLKETEVEEARKQEEPATKENITKTTTTTKKECDWNDLNLVGKWVMEAVHSLDSDNHQNED